MKITIEQLKGIDVTAYIDSIKEQCNKMHIATLGIPVTEARLKELDLRCWEWHSYFIQSGKSSNWYSRYEALCKTKRERIRRQLGELRGDIALAILLHNPELCTGITPIDYANSIDFNEINNAIDSNQLLFDTSVEDDLRQLAKRLQFNKMAVKRELEDAEQSEFKYIEYLFGGSFCVAYLRNFEAVCEFARLEYLHRLACGEYDIPEPTEKPIKWSGKTAHLGYIMGTLAESGYIDAPKKRDGEINYNDFARQIAKVFCFDGDSVQYLAKMLNPDSNMMEYKNKDKIQIPHIKEIS